MQGFGPEDSGLQGEVIGVLLCEGLEVPLCPDLVDLRWHFPRSNNDWECLEDLASALVFRGVLVVVQGNDDAGELHDH